MIKRLTLIILLVTTIAANSFAATYYVKPDGSDSNTGLSPAQRFATVTYAYSKMIGGDTIFIAGDHRITAYYAPLSGTVNDRTALVGWDGVNANTKLQGGGMITAGDTINGTWSSVGGGVYSATSPFGSTTMAGCLINDKYHLKNGGGTSPSAGKFGQSGSTIYVNIDGSTSPASMTTIVWPNTFIFNVPGSGESNRDYISIWGLQLKYSRGAVRIYEGGTCDYWIIERCTLIGANSTSAGNNTSLIRVLSSGSNSQASLPTGWIVRKNSVAYSTDINGSGHGAGMTFYDYDNFLVDSNYFFGTFQGDCIEIKGQKAAVTDKYNMTIAFNVMDMDNARAGINCPWNHHIDARIYGNLIIGTKYGLRSGDGASSNRSKRTWFYNNTVVNVSRGYTSGLDAGAHAGYDNGIKYNIFYQCSELMGRRNTLDKQDGGGTHWFIDSNLYFNTDGSANFQLQYTAKSFSQWQAIEGWDANSFVNTRDPLFKDTSDHSLVGYSRQNSPDEMLRTDYGTNPWRIYGAVQLAIKDLGVTDTTRIEVASTAPAGNDIKVTLELWFYHDAQDLASADAGFSWQSPNLTMDSSKFTALALSGFDGSQSLNMGDDIAQTNANKKFLFSGVSASNNSLSSSSTAQHVATYWMTYSNWTAADSIIFDTALVGSTNLVFVGTDSSSWFPSFSGQVSYYDPTDVNDEDKNLPGNYVLNQNFPNPFNPSTTISFSLPLADDYDLTIYNLLGQLVEKFSGYDGPGEIAITWNADSKPSGVYFYRLEANSFMDTKKMILLK